MQEKKIFPVLIVELNAKGLSTYRFPVVIFNNGILVIDEKFVYRLTVFTSTNKKWLTQLETLVGMPRKEYRVKHSRTDMPIHFYYVQDPQTEKKNSLYLYGIPEISGSYQENGVPLTKTITELYLLGKTLENLPNRFQPDVVLPNDIRAQLDIILGKKVNTFPNQFDFAT